MPASIRPLWQLSKWLGPVAIALAVSTPAHAAERAPTYVGTHLTTGQDRQAILAVLDTYTRAINAGDEALFESQLLDPNIPFLGLGGTVPASFVPHLASMQDFASFKRGFPKRGQIRQRFHDIHIEQDGDLAHASLTFENAPIGTDPGYTGWKTIQLLKVGGHWKIATEFYTIYEVKRPG